MVNGEKLNNFYMKKGPVVSNRTSSKMAKSNSYLTLCLYTTGVLMKIQGSLY